jgi:AcrR family transcriptional regulator
MGKASLTNRRARGRPRSEQAKQDILKSAYKLLKKKGISAVAAQEIASGAGVSTATLYRWWQTKEALMFDACFEHVMPDLSVPKTGSPLARLREYLLRGAAWFRSEDGKVMARLITGIHGDKKLQQMYLERFYLPRRQVQLKVIEEAIACGELKRDTDPELLLDALSGPLFFRWLQGHAPADKKFAGALADKIIPAFMVKGR